MQRYPPDDLQDELKRRDLPISELLQIVERAEPERRDVLDAADDELTDLAADVGEPTARQQSRATRSHYHVDHYGTNLTTVRAVIDGSEARLLIGFGSRDPAKPRSSLPLQRWAATDHTRPSPVLNESSISSKAFSG